MSAPNTTGNIPEGAAPVHSASSNVTWINLKGASALRAAVPYQGAVVFAVLVGQVCNGGWNAGTEELLPLVQVALMDFVQELMVSA